MVIPYNQQKEGFTLIELLITIAIIGILSSIAVPAYMGLQAQARRGSLIHTCNSSVPELQSWINAVKRSDALQEIDTNGDNVLTSADMDNSKLASSGLVTTFIASRSDVSPWNTSTSLWANGGKKSDQAACDNESQSNIGQITLCYTPNENSTVSYIFFSARDNNGSLIYQKSITAD